MEAVYWIGSSNESNECACEDWERRKQKRAVIFHNCPSFDFKWCLERSLLKRLENPNVTKQTIVSRPIDCPFILLLIQPDSLKINTNIMWFGSII
jgi:hypothetical protein